MNSKVANRLVGYGLLFSMLSTGALRAAAPDPAMEGEIRNIKPINERVEDDALPETIRDYRAKQKALPHVASVRCKEFKDDELLKLFPDALIRSFHVTSTFDPEHAKLRGMPNESKRLYVHGGGGRVYTAFDRKDMLALARSASLRLDTHERRKWFAKHVSGPVILAVTEQEKGSWLIHWGYSGRVGGGTALLTVDEKMLPVNVRVLHQ